jgi:hypothetical protein
MLSREGIEGVRRAVDAAEQLRMPDPEPLIAPNEEPRPYPLDALSPTTRAAVTAYQHFGAAAHSPCRIVRPRCRCTSDSRPSECWQGQAFGWSHIAQSRCDSRVRRKENERGSAHEVRCSAVEAGIS